MKTIYVVAAIIIQNQKVFCCQRKDEGLLAKKWEFPGGKIEEGETKEEALIREIKEELNTDIKVIERYMTINHKYESFNLIMDTYFCAVIKGNLELREHMDAKWVQNNQLKDLDWAEADVTIINKIINDKLL